MQTRFGIVFTQVKKQKAYRTHRKLSYWIK